MGLLRRPCGIAYVGACAAIGRSFTGLHMQCRNPPWMNEQSFALNRIQVLAAEEVVELTK